MLVTLDSDAVMVAEPVEPPVARPLALIEAAEEDDCQETCEVRFCVEPSLNVPVAVNCCVVPAAIDAFVGATLMELRTAEVIATEIDFVTSPEVPVIVAFP